VEELSNAEKVLRISEQKFRNLIEHAQDAILIVCKGKIIFTNWAIEEITGYTPAEIRGTDFMEYFYINERKNLRQYLNEHTDKADLPKIIETAVVHRNGYKVNTELNINRIQYEQQPALQIFVRDITARIQTRESLLASEKKFRNLFEASGDAILILNNDIITECNRKTTALFGGDFEDIIQQSFINFSPMYQPDGELSSDAIERRIMAVRSGRQENFEWQCKRVEGNTFFSEISMTKLSRFGDNLIQAIVRDITYRRNTEQLLREQKALLDEVFHNVQEGIGIVDENEKILFCNEAFASIFEMDKSDLIGYNILSFFESEAREVISQQSKLRKSGKISTYEVPFKTAGDKNKYARFNVSPRFGSDGEFAGGFAAVLDITAMKQNELELAKYREHLERLVSERTAELNRSNEYLHSEIKERVAAEKNLSFRLRYEEGLASYSGSLLSGFEENLSESLFHLLNASQVSRVYLCENRNDPKKGLVMKISHEVTAPGIDVLLDGNKELVIPYRFGFGRWEKVLEEGLPLLGHMESFPENERKILQSREFKSLLILPIMVNGQWYGYLGFEDMEKKREWNMEAPLLQTATDLMGSFIERKSYEDRLRQSKEEAEKISELKSQFLANVSHEIRTPLNGIIGFSELILSSDDMESINSKTKSIIHESESLLLLINDILDHAKIEAGKTVLDHQPTDLVALMEDLVSVFFAQAKSKELDFVVTVEEDVPRYILCDRLRLRQIMMNLLSNAFKFTEKGGINIHVENIKSNKDKAKLSFAVIDTGIGIPEEQQQNIFSSFSQADGSTTRKYGGTGLGTTISRQLVELMGGNMFLKSQVGEGSKFWFEVTFEKSLPPVEDPEEMDVNEDIIKVLAEERKTKATQILVVDDYPPNQDVARMHLEAAGHEVYLAEDGTEAVEKCNRSEFDLILMDIQMPNMDGYEASRRIRSAENKNTNIPIIALTANIEVSAKVDCLHAGMNDVITKPIRRKSFLSTVDKWLFLSDAKIKSEELKEAEKEYDKAVAKEKDKRFAPEKSPIVDYSGKPLDLNVAIDEFGSAEIVREVCGKFIDNVEKQIQKIETSLREQNSEELKREFHSIKGGSATLEAVALSVSAKKLEELSKNDKFEEIESHLPEFFNLFNELKDFYDTDIKNISDDK
jgi:PAS domain S-box-containing protein